MRRVWIVMFPDVQTLDVTGPLEVFSMAKRLAGSRPPPSAVSVVASPGSRRFIAAPRGHATAS